eukprot:SAG11_NODE_12435_length_703_cov_2.201987_1_plen_91_part_10
MNVSIYVCCFIIAQMCLYDTSVVAVSRRSMHLTCRCITVFFILFFVLYTAARLLGDMACSSASSFAPCTLFLRLDRRRSAILVDERPPCSL